MTLFAKVKSKKGWVVLIALLIIIIAGGVGAKVYFYERFGNTAQEKAIAQGYSQVCTDLLYLEQFETLKLKPDQAKQILPLMDRLAASGTKGDAEAEKAIYGTLTPVQYQTLLKSQNNSSQNYGFEQGSREKKGSKQRGRSEDRKSPDRELNGMWSERNASDPRLDALPNVVTKMLNERANETPAPVTP